MPSDPALPSRNPGLSQRCAPLWLAALALCLAALLLGVGSAHAAAPFGFIGMNAEDIYADSSTYQTEQLRDADAHGITLMRQNFRWEVSEPDKGVFDWTQLDHFVLSVARQGMEILPVLFGEPAWASSRPPGDDAPCTFPPRQPADFGRWAGQVAARYGRGGLLWREHPHLAYAQVTDYELWNEPNLKQFWRCRPSAASYVKLARAAADAIRAHDAQAYIISAGSPVLKTHAGPYFKAEVSAGAKGVFNAIGLHPYSADAATLMRVLRGARRDLDAHGDRNWEIMVTEFGWATAGPPAKARTVNEARQAQLVRSALMKMGRARDRLKIGTAIYYEWHDLPAPPGQADYWGLHTGLLHPDDRPKPALEAMLQASQAIH